MTNVWAFYEDQIQWVDSSLLTDQLVWALNGGQTSFVPFNELEPQDKLWGYGGSYVTVPEPEEPGDGTFTIVLQDALIVADNSVQLEAYTENPDIAISGLTIDNTGDASGDVYYILGDYTEQFDQPVFYSADADRPTNQMFVGTVVAGGTTYDNFIISQAEGAISNEYVQSRIDTFVGAGYSVSDIRFGIQLSLNEQSTITFNSLTVTENPYVA